ncbi:nucleotidyltransferase family protein [Methylacidiphilum kamchatkense]|uniref:nucleotidyltransferase family protein n=1 Tax=Methylacidiphilum kamchatkense TaxID=431057 RepID=UPI0009A1A4B3|nr:nucleotidyltransferase family protein [Methylacidiphilum kamchatkense]
MGERSNFIKKKFEEDQAPSICELHWAPCFNRVLDKKFLESTWKESSMSAFEDIPLQRMPKENELLFLLTHGSKHRWEKMSYLLDLHQFILWANFSQQDWERMIEKAFCFGWNRFCLLGLALSKNYYKSPIPEPVFDILEKSWITREEIFSVSKRSSSFPLPRHFTLLELFDSKKHKFFFILKSLRFPSSEIVKTYRLPFFLSFLYIPLSAFVAIRGWIQKNCSSLREFIRRIQ